MFAISTFAAVLFVAASPAAQGSWEDRTARVFHADLDLSSTAGRATLDRRVRTTINRLCGDLFAVGYYGAADTRRCRTESWSDYLIRRPTILADTKVGQLTIAAR